MTTDKHDSVIPRSPQPWADLQLFVGGALGGAFLGAFGGALLGTLFGVCRGDVSLGLDGAIWGSLATGGVGAVYGWMLSRNDEADRTRDEGEKGH